MDKEKVDKVVAATLSGFPFAKVNEYMAKNEWRWFVIRDNQPMLRVPTIDEMRDTATRLCEETLAKYPKRNSTASGGFVASLEIGEGLDGLVLDFTAASSKAYID